MITVPSSSAERGINTSVLRDENIDWAIGHDGSAVEDEDPLGVGDIGGNMGGHED